MEGRSRTESGAIAVAWCLAAVAVAGVGLVWWVQTLPGADVGENSGVGPATTAAVWAVTGALLVTARPRNSVGWLLILIGLLQAHSNMGNAYGSYGVGVADPQWPLADWVAQSSVMVWLPSLALPITVIMAVYPNGTLPSRRWRLPVGLVAVGLTIITLGGSVGQGAYNDIAPGPAPIPLAGGWWVGPLLAIGSGAVLVGAVSIWVMTGFRLARAATPIRQQLAWYVFLVVPGIVLPFLGFGVPLLGLLIPAAIAVGILRYQMLGIIVARGLVYALLTAAVVAVYVAVTAVASSTLDRGPIPGVVAAALAAVGLAPARERLQRRTERFVYGERQDPLRAVSGLGDRLATQTDLLPATLAGVMDAVRAPAAAVFDRDGSVIVGEVSEPAERLPLQVAGVEVGSLEVSWRSPSEPYSEADRRLLRALAPQVAVVVQAVGLAEALELERDRVLASVRSERARYRSDLHDELGPSLSGVGLSLQVAFEALDVGDTATARRMIEAARNETGRSVEEVRRIIDDLRPGILDEVGLVEAVRHHARSISPPVTVQIDALRTDLPPSAETAAYRIVREAVTNAVRHAQAQHIHVELGTDLDDLVVRVADDGRGISPDTSTAVAVGDGAWNSTGPVEGERSARGVGLISMRRRAEALGGSLGVSDAAPGTVITARLPLSEPQ